MQDATETFLHYLYYDKMDPRTSAQHVVAVLHVAHYYGAGRLVALCEAFLAKELKQSDKDDEGDFADLHNHFDITANKADIQLGPGPAVFSFQGFLRSSAQLIEVSSA